jgi:hypothetical protein
MDNLPFRCPEIGGQLNIVAIVGGGGTGEITISTPLGSASGGKFIFTIDAPPILSDVPLPTVLTGDDNFALQLIGRNIPEFASFSITPVSASGATIGISLPVQLVSLTDSTASLLAPLAARQVGVKRLTVRSGDFTASTTLTIVYAAAPIAEALSVSTTTASGEAFTVLVSGTGFFRRGLAQIFLNGEESLYSSVVNPSLVNVQIPAVWNVRSGVVNIRITNYDGQSTEASVRVIGRDAPLITSVTPRWVNGNLTFIVRGVAFSPRITAVLGRRQVTVLRATETELEIAVPPDYQAPTFGTVSLIVENPDGKRYGFLIGAPLFVPSSAFLANSKTTSELASSTNTRSGAAQASNGELSGQTSAFGLSISPNPVSETLTLEVPVFVGVGRLSILNARGEEVLSGVITGNKRMQVDVRSLASGAYFVRVVGENVRVVTQMTVVR